MSSIYDAPRQPPLPTLPNKFNSTPIVPEVSMICQIPNKQSTYSDWKMQTTLNKESVCRSNSVDQDSSTFRKHVRFEKLKLTKPHLKSMENVIASVDNVDDKENRLAIKKNPYDQLNLQGKTFEEIYMANIPNRHLDLSLVEVKPNRIVKETLNIKKHSEIEKVPKRNISNLVEVVENSSKPSTYKEYCSQTRKTSNYLVDNGVIDIFNYNNPKSTYVETLKPSILRQEIFKTTFNADKSIQTDFVPQLKVDLGTQTDNHLVQESNKQPNLEDLLNIIEQQKQQMVQLEKQVIKLQNNLEIVKRIPVNKKDVRSESGATNLNNGNMSSFSIDLLRTSFSFRPSHRFPKKSKHFPKNEPKIQEVTESDNLENDKNQNFTFNLQESLCVREECPSPDPSIRINMDDYQSSNDEEEDAPNIGPTLYNDLMVQINSILKRAQINNNCDESNGLLDNEKRMDFVKEATLKHLRSIGIHLPTMDIPENLNQAKNYSSDDISFVVKQLLMKYLPDEQLAKVVLKNSNETHKKNVNQNLIQTRPEFSFASIKYMQKYNLLKSNDNYSKSRYFEERYDCKNILGATDLKKQTKLL